MQQASENALALNLVLGDIWRYDSLADRLLAMLERSKAMDLRTDDCWSMHGEGTTKCFRRIDSSWRRKK
jgi:hypothetical protein